MKNFFEAVKTLITHTPPFIVIAPYLVLYFIYGLFGTGLYWFGLFSFRLQLAVTPDCCRVNIDKELRDREIRP